ncbi:hypothetical protein HDU92_007525 [Lobulomyces angularis]|nr:hypothetical protein HDU92_007525 [Lobulomyces angularis]
MSKNPLILFIHGFQGSKDSFYDFPGDLYDKVTEISNDLKVSFDTAPYEYDCKGDATLHSEALADLLINEANSTIRPMVFLISHSMGGILLIDALRELKKLNKVRFKKDQFCHSNLEQVVNVGALISFDTPYFGVQHEIILEKSLTAMHTYTTEFLESKVGIPKHLIKAPRQPEDITGWGFAGIATLAIGGFMYATDKKFKTSVNGIYQQHKDVFEQYGKFLGPLLNEGEKEKRMEDLLKFESRNLFYIAQMIKKVVPIVSESDVEKEEWEYEENLPSSSFSSCNIAGPSHSIETFILMPPPKFANLFTLLKYHDDSDNNLVGSSEPVKKIDIDAVSVHTSMFKKDFNPSNYSSILEDCTNLIIDVYLQWTCEGDAPKDFNILDLD